MTRKEKAEAAAIDERLAPLADALEAHFKTLGTPLDVCCAALLVIGRQLGASPDSNFERDSEYCLVFLKEGFHFGREDAPS